MKRFLCFVFTFAGIVIGFWSCEKTRTETGDDGSGSSLTAVDLGLSVKWASCNLGASKPSELGDFYAWGETTPKTHEYFKLENYKFYTGRSFPHPTAIYEWQVPIFSKYNLHPEDDVCTDNKTTLDPEDDAAHVKLGGKWRIPTKQELNELWMNCTHAEDFRDGKRGFVFKSSKNGNTLFLPIYEDSGEWESYYMSSTLYKSDNHQYVQEQGYAWSLPIVHGDFVMGVNPRGRSLEFSIRPVCE